MSNNKPQIKLIAAAIIGAILGAGALNMFQGSPTSSEQGEESGEKKPLYWVLQFSRPSLAREI